MAKAKTKEVGDEVLATVKRVVAQLEAKSENGKLTKAEYTALRDEAKKAAGRSWKDVAESVENFKP